MQRKTKYKFIFLLILLHLQVFGQSNLYSKISELKDSVKVGNLVIYNAFKYQVLAHQSGEFNPALIIEKVYKPHPELWDNCLSQIFGDAGEMFKEEGIIEWNKTLFEKQKNLLSKLDTLSRLNLDSLFNAHLTGLKKLTGLNAKGKWILYAGPDENYSIFLGGCNTDGMAIDLAHSRTTVDLLTEALPHELEHMVFEQAKSKDPNWNTSLGSTIDEGVACFFTYKYFKEKLPKRRVIENMTDEEFQWYIKHEKEIFERSLPFLFDISEEKNLYQCNCRAGGCAKLFPDAPKSICYFLGFRIVESYVNKYGNDSWKDVYKIPLKDFLGNSGYKEYIETLK